MRFAPLEGPTKRPCSRARRRISRTASSESTVRAMSTSCWWRSKMPGTKPSEMPSMRWSPTSPHRIVEDSDGSIAKSLTAGFTSLKACPTPIRVPPVPTPITIASGTAPPGNCSRTPGPGRARAHPPAPAPRPPAPTPPRDRVGPCSLGQLLQDLRPEPGAVLLDVPLAVELRGAEVAWLAAELLRLGERLVDVEVPDLHHVRPEGGAYRGRAAAHPPG